MEGAGDHVEQCKLDSERHIACFLTYGEKHVKFVECRLYTYTHDTTIEEGLFGKRLDTATQDNYR